MSLAQSFQSKKVSAEVVDTLVKSMASRIRSVCLPERIVLFGSAAEGRFVEGSDIDLLLIFATREELLEGRQTLRSIGRLCSGTAVDLVFVTHEHFATKKDLGGVCFIAEHEGRDL